MIHPRSLYLSRAGMIISNIIVKCLVAQMRMARVTGWKTVIRYMNEEFVREDMLDEEARPKYILSRLYTWYNTIYIGDPGRTIPMVPVQLPLVYGLEYLDYIDLLRVEDRIELFDFREIGITGTSQSSHFTLKQDWGVAARIWGFLHSVHKLCPTHYTRLIIKQQTITKQTMKLLDPAISALTEHTISTTIRNMGEHIHIPSIGEQCISCRFNNVCKKEEWSIC